SLASRLPLLPSSPGRQPASHRPIRKDGEGGAFFQLKCGYSAPKSVAGPRGTMGINLSDGEWMPMQHEADPAARAPAAPDNPPVPVERAEKASGETVAGAQPADPAPDIAALLQKVEAEAAELRDAWLRARADIDNIRKQAAADIAKAHKFALER